MHDTDEPETWRRPAGLFILAMVEGPAADRIQAIQREYDPKFATAHRPHLTLAGSSGVGPIHAGTSIETVRAALVPVAAATPPLALAFGPPTRFMQTNVVSLPLDPHGPLRVLHDRIAQSGLAFSAARFTFTPHVTLSFYPTLSRDRLRELLSLRITEPARFASLAISSTDDPLPPKLVLEIPLGG